MKKKLLTLALGLSVMLGVYAAETPGFPGGDAALNKYLQANMKYPAEALENGVEGVVTVAFIVKADGSLTSLKVLKMVDPDLEKEALRLVATMPRWIPAEKDGTPIEAPSNVEINFEIPD